MTTEQQVREQARELLAQECEVMGGEETARILRVGRGDFVAGCAIQALEKLMTQAAEDKRIADAVRGAEVVAYASETAWPPMQKKQRDRMIEDGQHGGEFAVAARTAATFTIPLIALPADAVGGG